MSIETYIIPKIEVEGLEVVLNHLANMKKRDIMVLPNEKIFKIHLPNISIKQVEFSKEANNTYSVRITTLACREDWDLYKDTIKAFLELTQGKAYTEEEQIIDNIDLHFSESYINNTILDDWSIFKSLVKLNKEPIGTYCPFGWYYIGKNIVAEMENYSQDANTQIERLWKYIRIAQYELDYPVFTPVFEIEDENSDKNQTLTGYNFNEFSYVSYADLFSINIDDKTYIIPYKKLADIKPFKWVLIDEVQFRARELNPYEWADFVEKMKQNTIM